MTDSVKRYEYLRDNHAELIRELYEDHTRTLTECVRELAKVTSFRVETHVLTKIATKDLGCEMRPLWTRFRTGVLPNGTARKARLV